LSACTVLLLKSRSTGTDNGCDDVTEGQARIAGLRCSIKALVGYRKLETVHELLPKRCSWVMLPCLGSPELGSLGRRVPSAASRVAGSASLGRGQAWLLPSRLVGHRPPGPPPGFCSSHPGGRRAVLWRMPGAKLRGPAALREHEQRQRRERVRICMDPAVCPLDSCWTTVT